MLFWYSDCVVVIVSVIGDDGGVGVVGFDSAVFDHCGCCWWVVLVLFLSLIVIVVALLVLVFGI